MTKRRAPEGLSASEFFERRLPGFLKADAMREADVSLPTIRAACAGTSIRTDTAEKLQSWSLRAIPQHGVYISAPKTLGVSEPGPGEIAAAAGGK
jgi:hypothetical protein